MLIYPAIDLREERCVRLVEGNPEHETVYSDDPAAMARLWQDQGATWLHVVDLDGAFSGSPKNISVIKEIISSVDIPVQVGGGIRDLAVAGEILGLGAARVIFGTVAITNPEMVAEACRKFGDAIAVGIDARDGKVAIEGWGVTAQKNTIDLAMEMKSMGVRRIIFTDIWRDGTLKGPNIAAVEEVARGTGLKVIASGGVSTLDDLKSLKRLEAQGVEGVIMGKSLYAGTISLKDALAIAAAEAGAGAC